MTARAAELGGGPVNVTMSSTAALPNRDSDLDAGVIAHEYGHGLSNRLTGNGPGCLTVVEQAGEGWSDWITLFMHAEPGDTRTSERSVGGYVSFEPCNTAGYIGIRRYPYTTDNTVNPLTYGGLADTGNSQPHGIGTIWATMLWEAYWNLVDLDGYDPDIYNGTGGNNVAFQLVMDGLKLQPCQPSFVQARDAILAADVADYDGVCVGRSRYRQCTCQSTCGNNPHHSLHLSRTLYVSVVAHHCHWRRLRHRTMESRCRAKRGPRRTCDLREDVSERATKQ